MFLRETPPQSIRDALESKAKTIVAAVGSDLTIAGAYGEEWLVLTDEDLRVYETNGPSPALRISQPLDEIKSISAESLVGGGALIATTKSGTVELLRYTNARESKISRVAKYINDLGELRKSVHLGKSDHEMPVLDKRDESDRHCPKCDLILPEGTSVCPQCLDKRKVAMRLLGYLKPYWKQTLIVWLLLLASMALNLIPPYLNRPLIDDVLVPKGTSAAADERLVLLGLLVLALFGARILGQTVLIVRGRILAGLAAHLSHDLRTQLYRRLQLLSLRFFDKQQTGAMMTRVIQDTESLKASLLDAVPDLVVHGLTFLGICTVLFVMDWQLALLVIVPIPIVILLSRVFWKRIRRLWQNVWASRQGLSASLNDSLSGIRVVKAFAQEDQEVQRFTSSSHDLSLAEGTAERTHVTLFPLLGLIVGLGSLVVWYAGGRKVIGTEITLGTLMTFLAYLAMFYGPLQSLTRMAEWLVRSLTSAERVFEILDREPDVKEPLHPVALPRVQGRVEFRNVSFGYVRHKPVIRDFSLDVAPGEMIGLVGHSGAGKSTTINLLCRFYDVDQGQILVDGVDIRELPQHDLRSRIGVVLQDTFLFGGTIAENIRYAKPDASFEEVLKAAKTANAHEFIVQKMDGYDTRVGERGLMLSGGERQRISIARAILHDPRILILDEATSSVDTDTEKQIQEAIARLIKGRTTFAIAHRLSTLRNASRLVVLKGGEITEVGTHDELLAKKGEFHRLVEIQKEISQVREVVR